MTTTASATVYARAFLAAADAQKLTGSLLPVVANLSAGLNDAEVNGLLGLGDPRRGPAAREALVKKLATELKLPALLKNLLSLLAANRRLGEAGAVLQSVVHQANARAGKIEARVETAAKLTDAQVLELKKVLMKKFKATDVVVTEVAAPGLLGGFRAFAAGRVWDCSLQGRLRELAARFTHSVER